MSKTNISKSILIKKSKDEIYNIINNFDFWTIWSPWLIIDPDAVVNISKDKKYYEWDGKRVGKGNMQVINELHNKRVDYELNFLKPWKSFAKVSFILEGIENETNVTWTMDSKLPFFLFWMKKSIEAFVGMDYERGLKMLKEYLEKGKINSKLEFLGEQSFDGCKYAGVRKSISMYDEELSNQMEKDFDTIQTTLKQIEAELDDYKFSQYHKWDVVNKKVEYTSAQMLKNFPKKKSDKLIMKQLESTNVYVVRHTGSYEHLGNAWNAVYSMVQNKEIKPVKKYSPFEVYLNDPSSVSKDELITDIYFPIK